MNADARRVVQADTSVRQAATPRFSPSALSGLIVRLERERPDIDVASLMSLAEHSRPIEDPDLYAFGVITLISQRRGQAKTPWDAAQDPVTGRAVTTIWLRRNVLFDEMKERASTHGYERGFAWVAACVERGGDGTLRAGSADEALRQSIWDRDGSDVPSTVLRLARESGLRPASVDVALWLAASCGML